jgi:hypothetical protein
MTQIASPEAIVAPFDNVQLTKSGHTWRLERRGDQFWVDMIDPVYERDLRQHGHNPYTVSRQSETGAPRRLAQVLMTTGSHHRQSYWVSSGDPGRGNQLLQLPWTYQIDEQKWIPLDDAFLHPANTHLDYASWNESCIGCHAVAGKPGLDVELDFVDSSVVDFGIACESCHGPGGEHADHHRRFKDAQPGEPTIVNPRHCSHRVSSQICGACHSFSYARDYWSWRIEGHDFRPGQDLETVRVVSRLEDLPRNDSLRGGFWDDGTARTGGREYNSLSMSACYQKGTLGCLSCHSMHNYMEADHQLATGMQGNDACISCHAEIGRDIPGHTHHDAESAASLCYSCHMPYTSYALLSVVRSHRIDSPRVSTDVQFGRPNACNLCHLDQTLDWTDSKLSQWFGTEKAKLSDEQRQVAASLLWLLRGDPAQRVTVAGNFGLAQSREASGEDWMAPFLAVLLEDPYSAVRWVAYESLKELPGFSDVEFNFVGSAEQRRQARQEITRRWTELARSPRGESRLLLKSDGSVDTDSVEKLVAQRNDRATSITE